MPEPYEITVSEAARDIREGRLSPVELTESLLHRIDGLGSQLKAWVYLDRETVLADAEQKRQELDRGTGKGLLHGVPIAFKDI